MAFRKIHESFWTDPDIEDLTPEQKYFYLYLLTNPANNQIGLFEFSKRRASFETGYNTETIEKLLQFFQDTGKIVLSKKTKEIVICKFWHYNSSTSPKVLKHVEDLIASVKDTVLIQYIYSMDTVSQEEEEKEEDIEKEKEQDKIREATDVFIELWNKVNECSIRYTPKKRGQVKSRLKTFTPEEISNAIIKRGKDPWILGDGRKFRADWDSFWRNDEKVERYLNSQDQGGSNVLPF